MWPKRCWTKHECKSQIWQSSCGELNSMARGQGHMDTPCTSRNLKRRGLLPTEILSERCKHADSCSSVLQLHVATGCSKSSRSARRHWSALLLSCWLSMQRAATGHTIHPPAGRSSAHTAGSAHDANTVIQNKDNIPCHSSPTQLNISQNRMNSNIATLAIAPRVHPKRKQCMEGILLLGIHLASRWSVMDKNMRPIDI